MNEAQKKYHWKPRLIVGLLMLVLAFVGLVLTYAIPIAESYAWEYWIAMGPTFAVLALALSWYLRHTSLKEKAFSLWHEILHWAALIATVFLIHFYVNAGIIGKVPASLVVLVLLSFSTFLTGVYLDTTFSIIGIVLGLLALLMGWLTQYLAIVLIVVGIVAVLALLVFLHRQRKKFIYSP